MGRILGGILLGAAIGAACVWLVEGFGGLIFPLPQGFDPYTAASLGIDVMAGVPLGAKLMVVFAWCLGALLGGGVAAAVSQRRIGAWVVAALIVAGALETAREIRHPAWMIAAGAILPWLGALAVQGLARRDDALAPPPIRRR